MKVTHKKGPVKVDTKFSDLNVGEPFRYLGPQRGGNPHYTDDSVYIKTADAHRGFDPEDGLFGRFDHDDRVVRVEAEVVVYDE